MADVTQEHLPSPAKKSPAKVPTPAKASQKIISSSPSPSSKASQKAAREQQQVDALANIQTEVVSDGPVELPDQSQNLNEFDEEVDEGASYYSNCFLFCLLLGVYLILKQLVLLNKNRWKGKESTTKRSDN